MTATLKTTIIQEPSSSSTNIQLDSTGNVYLVPSSGNVGIGTTSPGNRLHIYGSSNGTSGVSIQNTGGSGRRYTIYSSTAGGLYFANDTGGGDQMVLDASGNLLVGTTSSSGKITNYYPGLTSVGMAFIDTSTTGTTNAITFNKNSTAVGSITTSNTATAYNVSSDYRLKENVTPMTTGLATVSALKPVTYDWISDKSAGEGFIAHELQAIVPLAVHGEKDAVNEDGSIKPQGVDYSKIVVHLVAAMQEQQATITALTARIATLEAK